MKIIGGLTVIAMIVLPIFFGISWIVMLGFGALGHVFDAQALYISFYQSIIVTIVLTVLGSLFSK